MTLLRLEKYLTIIMIINRTIFKDSQGWRKILDKRPEKMRPGGLREINTTNTKVTTRKTKKVYTLTGHIASYVQRLSEEKLNGIPIYSVPLWSASSSEYFKTN